MKLKEFGNFVKLPFDDNEGFREFIQEAWNKRYILYEDNYSLDRKQQFLTFDGNKVKAKNYVGFISYGGKDITVYPKIFDDLEKEELDKYFINNLFYWLNRSNRIKFPFIDTNIDLAKQDSFLEVLIYIFSRYTYNLIHTKPFNCYEEVEEEITFLKGRLNINKYLKENISTGRWEKFNTIHEPFIYNNKFNQIIKFVATKLINISNNNETMEYLSKIKFILDEVDDIYCNEYSCNEVKLSRLQEEYKLVLAFCDIFLKNTSIAKNNNESKIDFCFLLPMEIIFEDFTYNFIKEKFSEKYKEITAQKSNLYLADVLVDNDNPKRAFNLKQDVFLKDYCDNVTILDTKYKLLDKNEENKYGISQSDMYQMCSYALKGGYTHFTLIYPAIKGFDKEIKYRINSGLTDKIININVVLISFALEYEECKINNFRKSYLINDEKILNVLTKKLIVSQINNN